MATTVNWRRLRMVVGVIVFVLALTVAVTLVVLRLAADRDPASPPVDASSESTITAAPAPSSEPGRAPGCQAGTPITNASLLQAQADAPLTDVGAAAFSADLYRWLGTNPTPEQADELSATIDQILAADAEERVREMFAGAVDQARAGKVPDPWWVSTVDEQYYIESSTDFETVVSVSAARVFDNGSRQSGTQTFTLVPTDQGWQLRTVSQMRTTADLRALGTTFSEGC